MDKLNTSVALNFCYLSLVILNVMNYAFPIPISFQLFVSSLACIYIGSRRGIILKEKLSVEERRRAADNMTVRDAYLFPIYGSIVLVGLYVIYAIFDRNLLNIVLSFHFTVFGFLSLIQVICYHLEKLFPEWENIYILKNSYELDLGFYTKTFNISINRCELFAGILVIPPTVGYFVTRHWLLNNIFGISFSICGIESLVLPTFQVGFILLFGLLIYDVFWVFETDIMLTVAKSVDAPIKLLFPLDLYASEPTFSMLGLGDIVIPGIFIALCLKYDVDKAIVQFMRQGIKEFEYDTISTPYFYWCLVGYAVGILLTFSALLFFNSAQPALLFLVPCCCLSVILCALKHGEFKKVFEYSEEQVRQNMEHTTVDHGRDRDRL